MGREIYMRDATDPNFQDGVLEVSDEVESLLGQIKMMLMTRNGEILGAPDFGAGLEEMLFAMNLNEFSIRMMLRDQTIKFIPAAAQYRVDYDVKFAKGTVRDICLIDVFLNNQPAFGLVIK